MNKMSKILYDIGNNPVPFICGWLCAVIGLILAILIFSINGYFLLACILGIISVNLPILIFSKKRVKK